MPRNTVFISYPSEDAIISAAISAAVSGLRDNKLDVFLDRLNMKGGQRIPDILQSALKDTVYFVAVATNVSRRNFDWCGQELGFYQGSNPDANRRETCLYDQTSPELFAGLRNFKAQALKREHREQFGNHLIAPTQSDFFDFLKGVAELNAELHPPPDPVAYFAEVPSWAEYWAVKITDVFFTALQNRVEDTWYPQGRIQISIDRGDFYKDVHAEIPSDSEVALTASMYNIFGLGIPSIIKSLSWSDFIHFLRDNTGGDILANVISDVVINALPSKAEAKNDFVYQAPNLRFYRVLLVRHSVYGNKRRDVVINLVQTLDKVQGGDFKTTALVAGIVLGSKYRSVFVEHGAKYAQDKLRNLDLESLATQITQMLRDINRINTDAASDGLADFGALEALLGNTDDVKMLFRKWWDVFPAMEASAKEFVRAPIESNHTIFFKHYDEFVSVSRQNNLKFLLLCLDSYRALLQ